MQGIFDRKKICMGARWQIGRLVSYERVSCKDILASSQWLEMFRGSNDKAASKVLPTLLKTYPSNAEDRMFVDARTAKVKSL